MIDRKTLLLSQAIITFVMALFMSGLLSFLQLGFTSVWLHAWGHAFLIAWPAAFILIQLVGPVSFKIAARITGIGKDD